VDNRPANNNKATPNCCYVMIIKQHDDIMAGTVETTTVTVDGRKISRRKRKLPEGTSSLIRDTIQEYGIYDKQGEAIKTKFGLLFQFIGISWQRAGSQTAENVDFTASLRRRTSISDQGNAETSLGTPLGRSGSREMCLEEELEAKLVHMTSVAKTLRELCAREKELSRGLLKDAILCRDKAQFMLTELIAQFHFQTASIQTRLIERDAALAKLQHENTHLKDTCEQAVIQANAAVESAQANLAAKRDIVEALKNDLAEKGDMVQQLRVDMNILKEQHTEEKQKHIEEKRKHMEENVKHTGERNKLMEENDKHMEENINNKCLEADLGLLRVEMVSLKKKLKEVELQAGIADVARHNFETLLDIAVSKLKLYEQAGQKPKYRNNSPSSQTPDIMSTVATPDSLTSASSSISIWGSSNSVAERLRAQDTVSLDGRISGLEVMKKTAHVDSISVTSAVVNDDTLSMDGRQNGQSSSGSDRRYRARSSSDYTSSGHQSNADSISMTSGSLETLSVASEYCLPNFEGANGGEDALSVSSLQSRLLPSRSPIVPQRRKNKKRGGTLFHKVQLRKTMSTEGSKSKSMERLPTIADEIGVDREKEKLPRRPTICIAHSDCSHTTQFCPVDEFEAIERELPQLSSKSSNSSLNPVRKSSDPTACSTSPVVRRKISAGSNSDRLVRPETFNRKPGIQRTNSFGGGLKSLATSTSGKKTGLVAIANDIQKRFKKKRRCKTADFSEIRKSLAQMPSYMRTMDSLDYDPKSDVQY